jgi:hypothetical protein
MNKQRHVSTCTKIGFQTAKITEKLSRKILEETYKQLQIQPVRNIFRLRVLEDNIAIHSTFLRD